MDRKDFIKNSCRACASLFVLSSIASLESCSPIKLVNSDIKDNSMQVDIANFEKTNTLKVRNMSLPYDVFLTKKENNYEAIYMKCSHNDNPVYANTKGFNCPTHGSSFDLDGKVLVGPATEPLKKLKTVLENNFVKILLS